MRALRPLTTILLLGCASPLLSHPLRNEITQTGWARVKGEVMIYDTKQAMLSKEQNHCISAVSTKISLKQLKVFDGKKVEVKGRVLNYSSLNEEHAIVLRRKVLDGVVVSNFCLKDDIVVIDKIILNR